MYDSYSSWKMSTVYPVVDAEGTGDGGSGGVEPVAQHLQADHGGGDTFPDIT